MKAVSEIVIRLANYKIIILISFRNYCMLDGFSDL